MEHQAMRANINLHNIDCMVAMKNMKDDQFHLAIVDPPYGIGMDGGNVGYKGRNNLAKKDWDKEKPSSIYFDELFRVSQNQIIFGGNYFGLPPSRCFIVWDKGNGFKGRTYAECELAWSSFDKNAKIYKHDPLASRDYKNKIHPTQKPVSLYRYLLEEFNSEHWKILDTHVGSASIALACWDFKCDLEGYEIDKEYYDKALKRINNHCQQKQLF